MYVHIVYRVSHIYTYIIYTYIYIYTANHVPSVKYHVVNHTCIYIYIIGYSTYYPKDFFAVWQDFKSSIMDLIGQYSDQIQGEIPPMSIILGVFGPEVVDGWLDANSTELVSYVKICKNN